ncbi:ectin-like [Mytilus edulis]|uniref:ectin-like n=1 Tax=Mytilus edulis TaxID=6550 RepID=UPI0039EF6FAA
MKGQQLSDVFRYGRQIPDPHVGYTPINGGWSLWSEWSTCTFSCGGGLQQRSRGCNNPPPRDGAFYCVGVSIENQVCNRECCTAPVNGGWSNWLEWSTCSATCGGLQHRSRDCKNPLPRDGGKYCEDVPFDNRVCNNDCCTVFMIKVVYLHNFQLNN